MDRTLISVNFPNFVTVTLMAAAGVGLLALVRQVFMSPKPTQLGS